MKRLTARNENGDAYYPYCVDGDKCFGEGQARSATPANLTPKFATGLQLTKTLDYHLSRCGR